MTFKLNKRTLFTALLAAVAAICMALAICFLIPSSQTFTASAEDNDHSNHSGWNVIDVEGAWNISTSGSYYLSGDISNNITISSGTTVTLCLNGKTLKSYTTGSAVIKVESGASLTLCDCSGNNSGKVTGTTKNSSGYGAGVHVTGTFTMEGGTITGNSAGYGGGVYVAGTFTMNGGAISGNTASSSGGGGVYVNSGTFTMNGGTISSNTANSDYGYGGGVVVSSSATFNMNGGTISSNTANSDYGYGGGVYIGSGNFTMNGGTISGNTASKGGGVYMRGGGFYMYGGYLNDGFYYYASVLGSKIIQGGYVSSTAYSSIKSYITSGYTVTNTNDSTYQYALVSKSKTTHTCNEVTFDTVLAAGGTLSGGKYFLTANVDLGTLGKDITISSGTVYLCLNGYTLTGTGSSSVITLSGGTLILYDCDGDNSGKITGGNASVGGGVRLNSGSTFTMYGGTITGNSATSGGGGVRVYGSGSTFTMSGGTISGNTADYGGGVYVQNSATFKMNDGTISDNSVTTKGGGVYVSGATFTMSGGKISSNKASSDGGGVYVYSSSSKFTMSGGEISSNTASYGGGVYVSNNSAFTMNGGTITQNTASSNGGGVYVSSGTFTLSDSGTISSNEAGNGGGVYVSEATFTMSGGAISQNKANSSGGGVYVDGSTFTMYGGTITGNSATSGGGVYVGDATFIMSNNGTISSNTASSNGGGVYVNNGTFTMSNGTVISNKASSGYGGGVYVDSNGKFVMSNGAITSNEAKCGAGVNVVGTFTMSNGTITKNSATSGGGIHVDSNGTFNMTDGTILQNTASQGGGVYVDRNGSSNGKFTMNGGTISSNTASGKGGGVLVYGTFNMEGGTISENTANAYGGGVYVNQGTFTMSDGKISSNKASSEGGGVHVGSSGSKFTMTGGEITGNTSNINGGGVCVGSYGTFAMENGTISDNTATYYGNGVYGDSGTFTMTGGYLNDKVYKSSGTVSIQGGYFSEDAYSSIEEYIEEGYAGVNLTVFASAYSSERSKRSTEDYPYAVYADGNYKVEDITVSYGDDYVVEVGNACGTVYIIYTWCEYSNCLTLPYSVGSYEVTADIISVSEDGTICASTVEFTITITPKSLTESMFCVTAGDYTYNGQEQKATYICNVEGLTYGSDYTVEYSDAINAGTVTITFTGMGNYTGTVYVTYEIAKAEYDLNGISFSDYAVTYDEKEHSLAIVGKLPEGITVAYYYVGIDGTIYSSTEAPTNAGTYMVTAVFASDNYAISDLIATLTIAKADYTLSGVSLSGDTVTYDGSAHSLAISGELPEGITVTYYYEGINGTTYSSTKAPTNAGTYTVTAVFASDNYAISDLTATLTIKKATLTVEAITDITANVGDTLEDIELPEGWSWSGSTTFTEVGEYEVDVTYSAGDNYESVTTTITVSVSERVSDSGVSAGEIAGFVIVCVGFVALVAGLIIVIRKRKEEVEK